MAKTFFLQTMSLISHRYAAFFYRKMFCSLSRAVHVHIISKILLLFPPYLCVWIEILEKSLWYGLYSIVFSCFISILFWKGTIKTYCLNICFLHFFWIMRYLYRVNLISHVHNSLTKSTIK